MSKIIDKYYQDQFRQEAQERQQLEAARAMLAALKSIKALTDTGEPDWNDAIGDHARAAIAQAEAAGIK